MFLVCGKEADEVISRGALSFASRKGERAKNYNEKKNLFLPTQLERKKGVFFGRIDSSCCFLKDEV